MAKEKFNWKGLFINDEGANEEAKVDTPKNTPVSFPETNRELTQFPDQSYKETVANNDILNTIVEMYQSGFESLNKPGYDFYEFFKAIKAVGSNDASVYKMAYSMAQGVDSKVTKESLLEQAGFYIAEIDKVHKQYEGQGNSKKSSLENSQIANKKNLTSEISDLEKKLIEIQNQISEKKEQLKKVDSGFLVESSEVDQKLIANNAARSKILETINSVVNGIQNNI